MILFQLKWIQNYQADDDIAGMIESRLEKLKSVK